MDSIESWITTMQAGPVYMVTLFVLQTVPAYSSAVLSESIVLTLYIDG